MKQKYRTQEEIIYLNRTQHQRQVNNFWLTHLGKLKVSTYPSLKTLSKKNNNFYTTLANLYFVFLIYPKLNHRQ